MDAPDVMIGAQAQGTQERQPAYSSGMSPVHCSNVLACDSCAQRWYYLMLNPRTEIVDIRMSCSGLLMWKSTNY